jgi:hypothetical protein
MPARGNRGARGGRNMRDKGLATVVATLLAAFATAHLMQFGLSAGRAISGDDRAAPVGVASFVAWRGAGTADLPDGPDALPAATPATLALGQPTARLPPRDAGVPGTLDAGRGVNGFGLTCSRALSLLPAPGTALRVRVEAPCDPGVRVVFAHAGLRFAAETGADGTLETVVPALMAAARVDAAFADGDVLTAEAQVPEAADVTRVVLVADGWAGLTLHPRETTAWRGRRPASARARPNGSATRTSKPRYSPRSTPIRPAASARWGLWRSRWKRCSRQRTAPATWRPLVIRTADGLEPETERVRLSMPACAAAGDLLVLDLQAPTLIGTELTALRADQKTGRTAPAISR